MTKGKRAPMVRAILLDDAADVIARTQPDIPWYADMVALLREYAAAEARRKHAGKPPMSEWHRPQTVVAIVEAHLEKNTALPEGREEDAHSATVGKASTLDAAFKFAAQWIEKQTGKEITLETVERYYRRGRGKNAVEGQRRAAVWKRRKGTNSR